MAPHNPVGVVAFGGIRKLENYVSEAVPPKNSDISPFWFSHAHYEVI